MLAVCILISLFRQEDETGSLTDAKVAVEVFSPCYVLDKFITFSFCPLC